MSPIKIAVTRRFPGSGLDTLQQKYPTTINETDRVLTPKELKQFVVGADAIASLLTDNIDGSVMDAAGAQLKLIANYAVGFDNIDLEAAKKRNIIVTNTPGDLADSVSEFTMALILSVARRIVEADHFTRTHQYKQWEPALFLGQELKGKTLGLVGVGRIGSGVARMAQGFGIKTIYYDVIRYPDLEETLGLTYQPLESLFQSADIISLHVPLLPTTHHLINADTLQLMKPTAIIVNTARGPVIDEAALISALEKKQIWGAGLDVFEFEPTISDALAALPNVVLAPHIGSATEEAREQMSQILANNVIAVLEGGQPLNPVTN